MCLFIFRKPSTEQTGQIAIGYHDISQAIVNVYLSLSVSWYIYYLIYLSLANRPLAHTSSSKTTSTGTSPQAQMFPSVDDGLSCFTSPTPAGT